MKSLMVSAMSLMLAGTASAQETQTEREAAKAEFDLARDGWSRFLDTQTDADMARVIHYKSLKGDPFQSPLGDILAHLPVHGQHHRGQVNADLCSAGIAPPAIDFIHAARSGLID